jgi:hypothetical protein
VVLGLGYNDITATFIFHMNSDGCGSAAVGGDRNEELFTQPSCKLAPDRSAGAVGNQAIAPRSRFRQLLKF